MKALILWLHRRRLANILLLVSYFLLVVLPHEQVGLLTVDIFGHLPRDTYNLIILIAGIISLGIFLVPFIKRLIVHPERKKIGFYLIATVGFIALTLNTLFVVNIEIVHFFQYAGMVLLVFPLTLRFGETLFWATLLGALDEAYQYFYLAPERTDYYDFNDVITNLLGAALMLVYLRTYDFGQPRVSAKKWFNTAPFYVTIALGTLIIALYQGGILGIYPAEEALQRPFLLVRVIPPGFWSVIPPEIVYHVVQPLEGTIITVLLLVFYSWGLAPRAFSSHYQERPLT